MGDLNGWVGDRMRKDMIGAFGVSGEHENVIEGVNVCVERGVSCS